MVGRLSEKELDALLDAFPFEFSFIDSEDTVRYFNKGEKRDIFPRSPVVIGRKVQQCHPPKSLDKVNAILSGFKSGKL
ncbi:MAG: PAS domain-containing protein, partial [Candidatus Micrarchaeota archaeon]